ncbi:MAG: mtfA protein [Clostridiales bacterium]|nr:mtfA protein [Clostridiales bacterium]
MQGITFGDKHSYNDWGLYLVEKNISLPSVKTNTIDIPGSDGVLDLTEIFGEVNYENRKGSFEFVYVKSIKNFFNTLSKITNYCHGKHMKIVLDSDKSFYYIGRVEVDQGKTDKSTGTIVINIDVNPYKYEINDSTEEWMWDSFNFNNGIIRNYKNVEVKGRKVIIIPGRRKKVIPIFTSSEAMQIYYNGQYYELYPGKSQIIDILFSEGENIVTIIGTGIVSIEYRGGSL